MDPSHQNMLFRRFPPAVQRLLEPSEHNYARQTFLISEEQQTDWAFFPHLGTVISMTRSTDSGATVEVGIVGWEAFVSVQTLLNPVAIGSNAVVQVAGSASKVRLEKLREVMNSNPEVRDQLLVICGAFLSQVSQHAICNRLHSIEQRLAKWLVGVRDRIESDQIGLTHESLSQMLGIRRSSVTVAVGDLALDGLITNGRSSITVRDRDGLEHRACECYAALRDSVNTARR